MFWSTEHALLAEHRASLGTMHAWGLQGVISIPEPGLLAVHAVSRGPTLQLLHSIALRSGQKLLSACLSPDFCILAALVQEPMALPSEHPTTVANLTHSSRFVLFEPAMQHRLCHSRALCCWVDAATSTLASRS